MNYLECRFDYGAWAVEIRNRYGSSIAIHEWLIVALWRAWRQTPSKPQNGEAK